MIQLLTTELVTQIYEELMKAIIDYDYTALGTNSLNFSLRKAY